MVQQGSRGSEETSARCRRPSHSLTEYLPQLAEVRMLLSLSTAMACKQTSGLNSTLLPSSNDASCSLPMSPTLNMVTIYYFRFLAGLLFFTFPWTFSKRSMWNNTKRRMTSHLPLLWRPSLMRKRSCRLLNVVSCSWAHPQGKPSTRLAHQSMITKPDTSDTAPNTISAH